MGPWKNGVQIWAAILGPDLGPDLGPKFGPKLGSQIWAQFWAVARLWRLALGPSPGPKFGPNLGPPNVGPKFGAQNLGPKLDPNLEPKLLYKFCPNVEKRPKRQLRGKHFWQKNFVGKASKMTVSLETFPEKTKLWDKQPKMQLRREHFYKKYTFGRSARKRYSFLFAGSEGHEGGNPW